MKLGQLKPRPNPGPPFKADKLAEQFPRGMRAKVIGKPTEPVDMAVLWSEYQQATQGVTGTVTYHDDWCGLLVDMDLGPRVRPGSGKTSTWYAPSSLAPAGSGEIVYAKADGLVSIIGSRESVKANIIAPDEELVRAWLEAVSGVEYDPHIKNLGTGQLLLIYADDSDENLRAWMNPLLGIIPRSTIVVADEKQLRTIEVKRNKL